MTTLITGSAGSLGSEIAKQLKFSNSLDSNPEISFASVYGLDKNPGEHVDFQFDLVQNVNKVADTFKDIQPNTVIHCAANIYGVGGFNALPATILGHDLTMLFNTLHGYLETPEKDRKRFVYISSSMVYEQVRGDPELREELVDDAVAPKTEYGLSKFTGERLVQSFGKQYGIDYTIWRPFNIITPYERPQKDKSSQGYSHVFADFFENILIRKLHPLPIIGTGSQVRCFTWYEEVAQCIVGNLHNKRTVNQIYNIGNNEPVSMLMLANMIVEEAIARGHLPKDYRLDFKTVKEYPNDVMVRIPNINKALGELGFWAQVKTRESVARCMDEWEQFI